MEKIHFEIKFLIVPGYHCDGSLHTWFQGPRAARKPPNLSISHQTSQQLHKTEDFVRFTAVIHHGLWSGKTTSHFPCLSSPSLKGEVGKSTLFFLDCFAVSDSFNTAKYFCLVSKQLLGINVRVLKDLRPFPKAWAFLAFVPTSLKFLQAKFYKLCPLPDIAQQGGCWKNKTEWFEMPGVRRLYLLVHLPAIEYKILWIYQCLAAMNVWIHISWNPLADSQKRVCLVRLSSFVVNEPWTAKSLWASFQCTCTDPDLASRA